MQKCAISNFILAVKLGDKDSRKKIMPTFVAMLRGVNVGRKRVRMENLRSLASRLGFRNVRTYVQSGNLVFQTTAENPASVSEKIRAAILNDLGLEVQVIVRTSKELGEVIAMNPFLKLRRFDESKLHVTFLSGTPNPSSLGKLEKLALGQDRFKPGPQSIYLYCPEGYGRSKLSNTAIENALSLVATTRNWKTTNSLFKMSSNLDQPT